MSRMPCIRQQYHHSMDIYPYLQYIFFLFDSYRYLLSFRFKDIDILKDRCYQSITERLNLGVNISTILTIVINAGR